jgi:hypothetical protein
MFVAANMLSCPMIPDLGSVEDIAVFLTASTPKKSAD